MTVLQLSPGQVDPEALLDRYSEAVRYNLNPEKIMRNFSALAEDLSEKILISDEFYKKVRASL